MDACEEGGLRTARATLSASTTRNEVYDRLLDSVSEFLSFDIGVLFVARDGRLVRHDALRTDEQFERRTVEGDGRDEGGRVVSGFDAEAPESDVERARPVAKRAYRSQEVHSESNGDGSFESWLGVSLGRYGVLAFGAADPDAFDEQAVALIDVFAGYVVRFLDRASVAPEHALERAEQYYRALVEQFPHGLVTLFDEDHRYRVVGGTGFERLDRSADELEGRRLEDAFPDANVATMKPLYEAALDGESGTTEITLDGHVFRVHVVPVRDESGAVVAGMTVSQEITERKRRREELRASKKRYRTLLQAAPDPVFVADAATGEIIEVNEAAEVLRGQPRSEIVGLHQTDLHPDGQAAAYRDLFENHVEAGGTRRRLPDGSQLYAVAADGTEIPVEISVETIEFEERPVVYGIFRDVSDQLAYERTLTGLNYAARDLLAAESWDDVARTTVDAVTERLELPGATCYRFDEDGGVLRPVAHTAPDETAEADDLPALPAGETAAWEAFLNAESVLRTDGRDDHGADGRDVELRSVVVVPLGEHGVLVVGDPRANAFGERTVELVETLGSTAAAALDRVSREVSLKERERQLRNRTRELESLESMNDRIRNVTQALVRAETHHDVERSVCRELVESEEVALAWIGHVDSGDERLDVRAMAGDDSGYLERIDRSLTADEHAEPAVRAARTREPIHVPKTAVTLQRASWRGEALGRGFQSVVSVPLLYRDALHGVLTIYTTSQSATSETLQSVLQELGELVANALVSIGRKQALVSNRATELELSVRDGSCFFLRAAQETGCSLEIEGIVPRSDGSVWVFLKTDDDDAERLQEYADRSPKVDSTRFVESADEAYLQLEFTEPFIASILAEQGIVVQRITCTPSACRLTLAAPPTLDTRQALDVIEAIYPDTQLLAKHRHARSLQSRRSFDETVRDRLTERQLEVVELAYDRGYFESPKGTTSEELASELGFSTTALHNHLRAAERTLLGAVFDEGTKSSNRAEFG